MSGYLIKETHIFMFEPGQDFNFTKCALTVGLVLEGWNFLDRYFGFGYVVICRPKSREILSVSFMEIWYFSLSKTNHKLKIS